MLTSPDRIIDERIVWAFVDLETTGLSATHEVPLEFGIKLTDAYGQVLHQASWLVYENTAQYDQRIDAAREHHIVGPMHDKSGLWRDLDEMQATDSEALRSDVDREIVQWLKDCGAPSPDDDGVGLGMAGNSIGSLDRPFVIVHFPAFNEFIGYRNIDLSSFKEMVKRTNSELYANLKPIIGDKSLADHRTLGDIDACIREFLAYCDEFFITGDEYQRSEGVIY